MDVGNSGRLRFVTHPRSRTGGSACPWSWEKISGRALQQLQFFSAWKDFCRTSLTQSRNDAKEYLELFAPWRLGVRQSVGFGCGSAARYYSSVDSFPPETIRGCGAGRQTCNAGGPAGRTAGVARTTARSTGRRRSFFVACVGWPFTAGTPVIVVKYGAG
jgi:hypothetical protein